MSMQERILALLAQATGPICDDCLARELKVQPRQRVNQACRRLSEASRIQRDAQTCVVCAKVKLTNRRGDAAPTAGARTEWQAGPTWTSVAREDAPALAPADRPWYWEGNVQDWIVAHLLLQGYAVRNVADTARREAGKDIVAVRSDGRELWVSVKGLPSPKRSTRTQARHWFSHAIFDMVLYHGENPTVELAIGLPDGYTTYHALARRVAWLQTQLRFRFFWVSESGQVRVSDGDGALG